jgi:hypothetical protein
MRRTSTKYEKKTLNLDFFIKESVIFSILLLFIITLITFSLPVYGADVASLRLIEADNSIRTAFEVILETESLGINVSPLLSKYREALDLLVEAELYYRTGNTDTAIGKAVQCTELAHRVLDDALVLQGSSLIITENIFWSNIIVSLVGCAAFVIVLFSVWILFKRNYIQKLMKTKPEVESYATNE